MADDFRGSRKQGVEVVNGQAGVDSRKGGIGFSPALPKRGMAVTEGREQPPVALSPIATVPPPLFPWSATRIGLRHVARSERQETIDVEWREATRAELQG